MIVGEVQTAPPSTDRLQGGREMPALTVSEVKDATVSEDGALTSVTFVTKYVGDLDVTMPSACIDRLIAMLQDAKGRLQPEAAQRPKPSPQRWRSHRSRRQAHCRSRRPNGKLRCSPTRCA